MQPDYEHLTILMPRYNKSFNYKERFHSKKVAPTQFYCKLKIDHKTTIYIRSKESLKKWLLKYPNAVQTETTLC